MNNHKITFAPLIPLIGGFPLGAELALNVPPSAIYSYKGFELNDSHYVNYQQKIKNRNIPYVSIDDKEDLDPVDIVVCTPPCAGLSSFNSSKNPDSHGPGCAQNEWMYISITDAIKKLDAKVILVENAPALYTKKGKPVADKIYNIAKENGYSLTLYKTSTIRHGIPQDRRRCFAILWKSKVAPYMNFYNHSYDKFDDYVLSYKPNGINLDHTNTKILSDSYFRFLSYKFCNLDIRQMVKDSNTKSVLQFVNNNKLLDEAIDFFKNDGDVKAYDSALYIKNKLSAGGNIWDSSINIYDNNIGALTGRNMTSVLHPIEDRSLTIGECLYIMSFPIDFELLGGKKNMNHIAQNVPVHTARDIVLEAKKFILGELEFSNSDFVKQNNWKEEIDFESHSEEQIIDLFENQ